MQQNRHNRTAVSCLATGLVLVITLACTPPDPSSRTQFFPKKEMNPAMLPSPEHVWVFMLAGQSNMAGRGQVEPQDTIPHERVFTINERGDMILAQEPLHFYEEALTGLDCGLSFGKTVVGGLPDSLSVLLIPTAVGGSSLRQWLEDSVHRSVPLFTNFQEKVAIGKQYGKIKAILWHQGESDANETDLPYYQGRLSRVFTNFRETVGDRTLPILIGELGSFSGDEHWAEVNRQLAQYVSHDRHATLIATQDLKDKGDHIHFDSESQRLLGKRLATAFLERWAAPDVPPGHEE